jgi:ketosteroid isomerase-like protein
MVFEKLEVTKNNVFISGNGAAVKWTLNATGKNGKQATAEGISVFDINEDGKIQQLSSYWDDDAMMAQIRN